MKNLPIIDSNLGLKRYDWGKPTYPNFVRKYKYLRLGKEPKIHNWVLFVK